MMSDSLCRTDSDIVAGGHRLRVRRLDPPHDEGVPTLVFLHEGLGSVGQWKDFPEALVAATGLPALIYDRWGFGASEPLVLPRPDDYLWREAEKTLPELLSACGVERPLLVGHSDGGTIALLYAAAFPESPVACITEAAHVFVEEETLAGIRAADEAWRTADLAKRLVKYHGDKTESVFRGWTETWLRPSFRHWRMLERLPAITCPLLIIQGADDEYGTAAQVEAIVEAASGPAEPLLIPGCGHTPHHEQRHATLQAMAGFISGLDLAG